MNLARSGQWDEALASLCQVMPEAQARFHLAEIMDDMKMLEGSRQQLQLAIKADPKFAPAREILAELDQNPLVGQPGAPVPGRDPNPIHQAGFSEQQP